MSARPLDVRSPSRTSHSGLRTTRSPIPAASRNRPARAGGIGSSNCAATTGTPAPGMRAGRASGSSTSGRDGSATSRVSSTCVTVLRSPPTSSRSTSSAPVLDRLISTSVHAARPVGGRTAPSVEPPAAAEARSPRARAPGGSASGRAPGAGSPRAARRRRSGRRPRRRWPLARPGSGEPPARCCWIDPLRQESQPDDAGGGLGPDRHAATPIASATASPTTATRRTAIDSLGAIARILSGRPSRESRGKKNAPGGHPPGAWSYRSGPRTSTASGR